jgi:mono/diheme cytochrome c family protein
MKPSGTWGWVAALLLFAPAARAAGPDLDRQFTETVRPFVERYCVQCHAGDKPKGELDLAHDQSVQSVTADLGRWATVQERLSAGEMPPKKATRQPPAELRKKVVAWIQTVRREESRKNAGDPGPVLARRLSNAEYNYTIRDLTGVDLQPAREFPVDPTNQSGFDNSGESLVMSPALMIKYLQAARLVANHLVLAPGGIAFAPHPVLVDTDRDKYCVQRIVDFYQRQPTDYADYFVAAWRFQHRTALGQPRATLASAAADAKVSPQFLTTIWQALQKREDVGPLAKLQAQFRALPAPRGRQPELAREGAAKMRDFVVTLRRKLEPRFEAPVAKGLRGTSQPLLMWKNRAYATHRRSFDPAVLQVEGEARPPEGERAPKVVASAAAEEEEEPSAAPPRKQTPDDDLRVPAGQRARYEAAFGRFASVFPDAFYVSERGRNYLDRSKDKGRLLSAGFHNLMGYFRDDQPLYELVLDARGKAELDGLWREMDFVASATARTFTQFYLSESGMAKAQDKRQGAPITAEETINKVAESYRGRAAGSEVAKKAVEDHFRIVNADIRWAEKARIDAEPAQLQALFDFAARAYRHPLAPAEREDLGGYYRSLRDGGLAHEEALRDTLVAVLMSPDFCYRIDVVEPGSARALSDQALASRLSYFLWSSLPDAELLRHATAGDLHKPAVLAAQARRMLKDPRSRGLSTEFGGNWLDFRRFEQHNAVDRERFPAFTNDLRQAMFEEPIRFIDDVVRNDRSILDFVYGRHTFVNPVLAKHYGMTIAGKDWVRVDDARKFGRGGILPMAVFLTQNAPGLRTSPVKRGYWVVRRVLGEVIPPPPAVVPELPRDEAKSELPLREMLAQHRQDPACAACHARFDSFGLAFEGYGPVGEVRTKDLAGRPVDARASFPGGVEGTGIEGLTKVIKSKREKDFVDNLCRKLLSYGLGRSLIAADDVTIEQMKSKLASSGYHFGAMIEAIVQSPQFLTKRGRDVIALEETR